MTIAEIAASRKMGKLTIALLTPRTSETVEGTNASFKLDNLVADTTNIAQADATINKTECETDDNPIFENVSLGSTSVAMDTGDIPDELLVSVFGYKKDTLGNIYAPASYTSVWAKFEFAFDSSADTIVIPRVKVITKVTGSSLKTGMVKGSISGTAYTETLSVTLADGTEASDIETPLFIKKDGKTTMLSA